MRLILNVLWIVFGGLAAAFGWLAATAFMALSVVGWPWVPAALRMTVYTLLPFGNRVEEAAAPGGLSVLGNIVWFVFAGWWLALGHVVLALCLAVTIIGLPFAWAHLKLAKYSLAPVGARIVPEN